jgi:hypothetical protein
MVLMVHKVLLVLTVQLAPKAQPVQMVLMEQTVLMEQLDHKVLLVQMV